MTQAGGPAAINGFLYQILHHIGWLANIRLSGKIDGEDVQNALLILEPIGGGGDARAESTNGYLVEQYKTRKGGTWALSDIEAILCDLRKAVPETLVNTDSYQFVTDGRAGRLQQFNKFLANVKLADGPEGLSKLKPKTFRKTIICSDSAYFDHIVEVTRNDHVGPEAEREIVFHLLSHFTIRFNIEAQDIVTNGVCQHSCRVH